MQRPQVNYRRRLLDEIASVEPSRVLEVGCGGGSFLRSARQLGWELAGVDPDAESIAALRKEGFNVSTGCAEKLDYPDSRFDAVVFAYTAHHIEDWDAAAREAYRVGRAIFILDPWYEAAIPSQAVAQDFDSWCKQVDREGGMIHHECLSASDLLKPFDEVSLQISLSYLLDLQDLGIEGLNALAEPQLEKARDRKLWEPNLKILQSRAVSEGFSDDGAILLSVRKNEGPPIAAGDV
ncbi:MAG: class I SAM-dependent methyltransferase [Acidobacteriota bacterium]